MAIDAYERLRAAVLRAEPTAAHDCAIIRREGLGAWIAGLELGSRPQAKPARCLPGQAATMLLHPPPASELTHLIAGILVTLAAGPIHA